jgi:PIN domain nuclease of toxin-antitoxin system
LRTQQTRFWSAQRRSEIVIKRGLRKLSFPDDLEDVVREESFELMPISFRHLRRLETLPELHRDPFDRMLVAQTLTEGVSLVTNDRALLAYGVPALW